MALLYMDSFDAGDYSLKYDSFSTSRLTVSTTTRFTAGRSIIIGKDIAGFGFMRKYITASSEVYTGFAMTQSSLNSLFVRFYGDAVSTQHLGVYTRANGSIEVLRGSTSIAITAPGIVTANRWYFIEVKASINSTTGNVTVKINGQQVINFTGNTKNGGTANTIDAVELIRAVDQDGNNTYDDFYICDGTGSAPYNTFLGEIRIHALTPNAAGSSTQFTPSTGANYAAVDELPYSATDYVSSGTVGFRDTYQLSDLPAGAGTVYAVQNVIIAKKTDAATIALRPAIKSGASVYYGTSAFLGGSDWAIQDLRTTDPNTSVSWTASGVNALEAGFEVA